MKKLLSLLIGILIINMVLAAPPVPSPVKFEVSVNGYKINYEDTKVTNLNTKEVLTAANIQTLKVLNGVAHFDLSNFKVAPDSFIPMPFALAGNNVEAVVCNIHPKCTQTFRIDSFEPRTIKIEIVDATIPEEKYITKYTCWDGSIVSLSSQCPSQPPKTEYVCSDGTKVEDSTKCPIESKEHADEIVKQILTYGGWTLALGFVGLYLYYRRKKQYARAEKMAKTYIERRKK